MASTWKQDIDRMLFCIWKSALDRVSQIGCQRGNHAMNFHLIIEQCLGRYGLQGIV